MVIMVAEAGFEPAASRLSSLASYRCSTLLYARPAFTGRAREREVYTDLGFILHLHNAIITLNRYELLCSLRQNSFYSL